MTGKGRKREKPTLLSYRVGFPQEGVGNRRSQIPRRTAVGAALLSPAGGKAPLRDQRLPDRRCVSSSAASRQERGDGAVKKYTASPSWKRQLLAFSST